MSKSLKNKIIISTRPEPLAYELKQQVSQLGGTLLHFPMIETEPSDLSFEEINQLQEIDQYQWVTFSSAVGVVHFFTICKQLNVSRKQLSAIKYTAIGLATANKIKEHGYFATYTDEASNSKTYGSELNKLIPGNQKVLLVKGNLANSSLYSAFTNNQQVSRINIYKTLCPNTWDPSILELILKNKYDLLFFTSPSGFNNFKSLFEGKLNLTKLKIAAIGPTTAKAIDGKGLQPDLVCNGPSVNQVIDSFINYFQTNK